MKKYLLPSNITTYEVSFLVFIGISYAVSVLSTHLLCTLQGNRDLTP